MAASILEEIVAYKKEFVEAARRVRPLESLKNEVLSVPPVASFRISVGSQDEFPVRVIAEVKKGSPSKGIIRQDFDPIAIANSYAENGAAAISVLTDEHFFHGHLDYLRSISASLPHTPLLRKDFTIDEYQIYEARAAGASAILLIAAILDRHQLQGFRDLAESLGMDALTEVHLESEADLVTEIGTRLIGINNRNLHDFSVDLTQTQKVIQLIGSGATDFLFVAESGIANAEDVVTLQQAGAHAVLIGETFMREKHPGDGLRRLLEESRDLQNTMLEQQ